MNTEYRLTKSACYITGMSMAITANLPPLFFITFRNMYGFSYTMLGLLIVINFVTQLAIDLIFTFFTKYFNIGKSVKLTPLIVVVGLALYAVMPMLLPGTEYLWIVLGTVIFSVSSGLAEVLLSPVVAAIPSENPEREMSKLHSMYAWGTAGVVILSSLFIKIFGGGVWMYLALIWAAVPLSGYIMFRKAKIPGVEASANGGKGKLNLNKGILLCVLCIFLGGATECTMSQWASGFIENAIGAPKLLGDIAGVAMFAIFLGIGRSLYSKYGKNIINVMLIGMSGAVLCYIVAGTALNAAAAISACALTGLCTSMLWPGTLIFVEDKFTNVGVAVYALMAAGGDLGASVLPQLVGVIADRAALDDFAYKMSRMLGVTAEQLGMRLGFFVSALFPIAGVLLILYMKYSKGVWENEK